MKVLFHGTEFFPEGGGVGAYMLNMARALGSTGHAAAVVTNRVAGLPEVDTSESFGPVFRLYARGDAGTPRARDAVLSVARELRPDVIEGADHLGDCALLLRESDRPPVLIKVHTSAALRVLGESQVYYPWQRLTVAAALLRSRRQLRAERYCIEHADLLCVPARRMLTELRRQGLRLPQRVEVIPNPATSTGPDGAGEAARPTVLFLGRIDIGKGIQYLPALIARLAREFPDVLLEIAGVDSYARWIGSLRAWLERRLGNAAGNVRFVGRVAGAEKDAAYRRAWVVVLPSRWDNFPTVLLEAMGHARPVVASPHGGMPEMLQDTGGIIADPGSVEFAHAVAGLLRDAAARRRAGRSLQEKLEREYSPAAVVPRYVGFLESRR